eukprot:g15726.t1
MLGKIVGRSTRALALGARSLQNDKKGPYLASAVQNLRYTVNNLTVEEMAELKVEDDAELAVTKVLALLRISDEDEATMTRIRKREIVRDQLDEYSMDELCVQEVASLIVKGTDADHAALRAVSKDYDCTSLHINARPYFPGALFSVTQEMVRMTLIVQWIAVMKWLIHKAEKATATKMLLENWEVFWQAAKTHALKKDVNFRKMVGTLGNAVCAAKMRLEGAGDYQKMRTTLLGLSQFKHFKAMKSMCQLLKPADTLLKAAKLCRKLFKVHATYGEKDEEMEQQVETTKAGTDKDMEMTQASSPGEHQEGSAFYFSAPRALPLFLRGFRWMVGTRLPAPGDSRRMT